MCKLVNNRKIYDDDEYYAFMFKLTIHTKPNTHIQIQTNNNEIVTVIL
mgnify:CR=1 FL=1